MTPLACPQPEVTSSSTRVSPPGLSGPALRDSYIKPRPDTKWPLVSLLHNVRRWWSMGSVVELKDSRTDRLFNQNWPLDIRHWSLIEEERAGGCAFSASFLCFALYLIISRTWLLLDSGLYKRFVFISLCNYISAYLYMTNPTSPSYLLSVSFLYFLSLPHLPLLPKSLLVRSISLSSPHPSHSPLPVSSLPLSHSTPLSFPLSSHLFYYVSFRFLQNTVSFPLTTFPHQPQETRKTPISHYGPCFMYAMQMNRLNWQHHHIFIPITLTPSPFFVSSITIV